MPKYFFHRMDGHFDPDLVGTELPNFAEARRQAIRYAAESLSQEPGMVEDGQDLRVEVTAEDGEILFTLVIQAIETAKRRQETATL